MANRERQMRYELYRHYDENSVLLYVGISYSAFLRLRNHKNASAKWFDKLSTIKVDHYPSKRSAEIAELKAIKDENPLYNRNSKAFGDGKITYEDVVKFFGSQANAVRILRIPQTTISAWRRGIPIWHQKQIESFTYGKLKCQK